jgi:hypothetical protein
MYHRNRARSIVPTKERGMAPVAVLHDNGIPDTGKAGRSPLASSATPGAKTECPDRGGVAATDTHARAERADDPEGASALRHEGGM